MEPLATPDLDADRDPEFVRQSATASRAARVVLAVVVGLALLGVFGGAGPRARAQSAGPGWAVSYARFACLDAPLAVTVQRPPGDSAFTVTGDLADELQIESIAPTPSAGSWWTPPTGPRSMPARHGSASSAARWCSTAAPGWRWAPWCTRSAPFEMLYAPSVILSLSKDLNADISVRRHHLGQAECPSRDPSTGWLRPCFAVR